MRSSTIHHEDRELDALGSEYEPPSDYKVHWRTFAAIFALAMGNVCAAMSNTVSKLDIYSRRIKCTTVN